LVRANWFKDFKQGCNKSANASFQPCKARLTSNFSDSLDSVPGWGVK
jgi:hypothetical protein